MKKAPFLFFVLFLYALSNAQTPDSVLMSNGVSYYDSSKTEQGVTLIDKMTSCVLVDMKGKVLQNFSIGLIHVLPDGTMIGRTDSILLKFDSDLNIFWKINVKNRIHHDITVDEHENIYLLSVEYRPFMGLNVKFDVMEKYSPAGDLIYRWSLYDHLDEFIPIISKSAYLKNLHKSYAQSKDIEDYISQDPLRFFYSILKDPAKGICIYNFSHFNSIQVLPENKVFQKIPAFKKGNLLLSFNPYSCYGIINDTSGKIEWAGYLPERTTLHTPALTQKGTILVFQNSTTVDSTKYKRGGDEHECLDELLQRIAPKNPAEDPGERNWVSITEYDPLTNKKVWEYTSTPREQMQADVLGSVQRLANGNTLVCVKTSAGESRTFELTPGKKLVWDYTSPMAMYRAKRINLELAKKIIPEIRK